MAGHVSGISLAKSLELHLLQPRISRDDVAAGCRAAAHVHLAAVCVWPAHVRIARDVLAGSDTRVRAAIAFPYGLDVAATKLAACDQARHDGADALSLVLDHSRLAGTDAADVVAEELDRVLAHAGWTSLRGARGDAELTIVIEMALLPDHVVRTLAQRLDHDAAAFVQTSTGHHPVRTTTQHVRDLREYAPSDVGVIAVGGITTCGEARELIGAGAIRIGTSAALSILDEEQRERTTAASASSVGHDRRGG